MQAVAKKKKWGGPQEGSGRPVLENLIEDFVNLDTGETPDTHTSPYFPNMKSAAHSLKIDIAILKDARTKDCPAFRTGSIVHRQQLIDWLKKHSDKTPPQPEPVEDNGEEQEVEDDYTVDDELGGVGRTLKSLQQYERRAKRALDTAEKLKPGPYKTEMVKRAQDGWIKIVNALLKYDLSVSMAKRESGELIPIADAIAGVHALLAWHTVATSDALRNVIPECEGKTKYQIAALLDPALRSSIYRNFKLGVKIGKMPEWLGKCGAEFVKAEAPLTLEGY